MSVQLDTRLDVQSQRELETRKVIYHPGQWCGRWQHQQERIWDHWQGKLCVHSRQVKREKQKAVNFWATAEKGKEQERDFGEDLLQPPY